MCVDQLTEGQSPMLWQAVLGVYIYMYFKDFIYIFIHENRERERGRHWQREKQAFCREPDVGLDPRTRDHALS